MVAPGGDEAGRTAVVGAAERFMLEDRVIRVTSLPDGVDQIYLLTRQEV